MGKQWHSFPLLYFVWRGEHSWEKKPPPGKKKGGREPLIILSFFTRDLKQGEEKGGVPGCPNGGEEKRRENRRKGRE